MHTALRKTFIATDRWFNLAFVGLWFSYSAWAMVAAYFEIPDLLAAATTYPAFIYTAMIALTAMAAFMGAFLLKPRLEFYAVILFAAMTAGYGVVATAFAFSQADSGWGRAILIFASLIMPIFRIRHLAQRIGGSN